MENSIELRFESLRVELEKVEDILLKKIDSFEKAMIINDNSFKVRFEFPRHSDSFLLRIGLLIFDEDQKMIELKLSSKLIFRTESTDSPINSKENLPMFSKNHINLDYFYFISYFFS